MTQPFHVVIPARMASTRLPGKPLADIAGQPMIVRVWLRAHEAGAEDVCVATDSEEIFAAVEAAGGRAMMTRADHASGTDRIAEVAARMGWADDAVIINVQGDEPLIAPALIAAVAQTLIADTGAAMSTAAHPLTDVAECANPNVVKVVCNHAGRALYFSRAPIPWARDAWAQGMNALPGEVPVLRHVGIYGYRAGFLRQFSALAPAPLERCEALEQLRALWHGHAIAVHCMAEAPPAGVDTPEDLARVREIFAREEGAG